MGLVRSPLDPSTLSEPVRKVLSGPPALKTMAARGLAPLKPVDLTVVLYQLSLDADPAIKAAADQTAAGLPEKVLGGALADVSLDPRVLDFFAFKVPPSGALIDAILLNRSTADETVRELIPRLGERELDIVAGNEQRLLRAPAVIGALYMNPRARMSTVDRAVELAVRNNILVPGIPAWEEIVASVLGTRGGKPAPVTPDEDAAFKTAAAVAIGEDAGAAQRAAALLEEETPEETIQEEKKNVSIDKLSIPSKIRLATLGNAFARSILIRDTNRQVALAAIRSPGVTDNEVVKYSANRALPEEVVRVIANAKEWTKVYQVKVNLVNNPKCPLPVAMRFLPFLHDRDLRNIAKSRGVSSALTAQARKLVAQKGG